MGDLNQLEFIRRYRELATGPILEIGSKDYGNTPNYRSFFPGQAYVGTDLFEGKGVDITLDLSWDYPQIEERVGGTKFNTIICCSVLEHCREVFKVCENLQRLLNKGGIFFISVPFCWEYHAFPDDYWRFTPNGVKALFRDLEFQDNWTMISTSNVGEMVPIQDQEFFKIDLAPKIGIQKKRYGFFDGALIKALKAFSILRPLLNHIYVMPPVNVNMIGKKM